LTARLIVDEDFATEVLDTEPPRLVGERQRDDCPDALALHVVGHRDCHFGDGRIIVQAHEPAHADTAGPFIRWDRRHDGDVIVTVDIRQVTEHPGRKSGYLAEEAAIPRLCRQMLEASLEL